MPQVRLGVADRASITRLLSYLLPVAFPLVLQYLSFLTSLQNPSPPSTPRSLGQHPRSHNGTKSVNRDLHLPDNRGQSQREAGASWRGRSCV